MAAHARAFGVAASMATASAATSRSSFQPKPVAAEIRGAYSDAQAARDTYTERLAQQYALLRDALKGCPPQPSPPRTA